jgi:hypothetical protein
LSYISARGRHLPAADLRNFCSAGPRRGLHLLTARGVAVAVTGTVAVAVASAAVTAARMPVIQLT